LEIETNIERTCEAYHTATVAIDAMPQAEDIWG
jgi:hypothetical protein